MTRNLPGVSVILKISHILHLVRDGAGKLNIPVVENSFQVLVDVFRKRPRYGLIFNSLVEGLNQLQGATARGGMSSPAPLLLRKTGGRARPRWEERLRLVPRLRARPAAQGHGTQGSDICITWSKS